MVFAKNPVNKGFPYSPYQETPIFNVFSIYRVLKMAYFRYIRSGHTQIRKEEIDIKLSTLSLDEFRLLLKFMCF